MEKTKRFLCILLCIFMILLIVWFVYSRVINGIMLWYQLDSMQETGDLVNQSEGILRQYADWYSRLLEEASKHM